MTVYTTLPTDDLNLAVTVIDDPDLVVLNITPAAVNVTSAVTSVNGLVGTVTLDSDDIPEGTTNLYSDQPNSTTDDVTFNSVTADFFGVQHFTAKARETITAGQPVYISGHSGNTPEVMVADYDDPAKMPAFGIAATDIADNNNGTISTYGDLKNVDTTGTNESETWAVGDSLYVNGSKLTNIRPSLETQEIQKVAKVIRVHAVTGQMFLTGAGRSNDTPNLAHQNVFIGNVSGVEKRQLTSADVTNSAGYITASTTDTLTNKSGSNSQWTNDEAYIKADSTDTLTNKSGSNSQWTNDEGYTTNTGTVTPSSTDTFTNKSGNISQWTNDAGYLTSETDNQTLSFTTPNLSITSGNTVDLTTLTTGFITASSTETLTNKSGNISMFTNDANYSTTTGTVTPSSTDTFTNKSGSNSQWTNDEAYIKADSTDTLTNKSGNVSMFTNDAGYLTTETDSQTLSFTSPNLSISNGNTEDLSDLTDGGTY
jgi:hypothetical protein